MTDTETTYVVRFRNAHAGERNWRSIGGSVKEFPTARLAQVYAKEQRELFPAFEFGVFRRVTSYELVIR